jgi:subtilisin family serine protease
MTKYIVEDQKCFAAFTPNDPSWSLQWGPPCIRSQEAWDVQRGNHNVILAVLDTGVDLDHPDLDGNVDTSIDWDFVNNDNNADDDYGHGTHVAGIAAAEINNGIGIAGMAQAKIMAVKVLNRYGSGYWSWIASGITYAADNGADVINMSIQGTSYDPSVEDAADYAYYTKDVVVIAAAGNYGSSQNCYPAAIGSVMGVAALQTCTSRASFSNWGLNNVDIAAPGVNIYSTYYQNRYDYMDGTSMASPHVAGVACLYRCQRPSGSAQKIWGALLRYAEDLGDPGVDPYYGHGRVKANGPYSPPVD